MLHDLNTSPNEICLNELVEVYDLNILTNRMTTMTNYSYVIMFYLLNLVHNKYNSIYMKVFDYVTQIIILNLLKQINSDLV